MGDPESTHLPDEPQRRAEKGGQSAFGGGIGDTTADGLKAKASYVMAVMSARLDALGVGWGDVSRTNVYTAHATRGLADVVWQGMGAAREHGVHHFNARPPIVGIEFEMDLRGLDRERCLRA